MVETKPELQAAKKTEPGKDVQTNNNTSGHDASTALSKEAMQSLTSLKQEIKDHKQQEKSQSYLGTAFDFLYRKDEKSLVQLELLDKNADAAIKRGDLAAVEKMRQDIDKQVKEDKRVRGVQGDINFYGSTGLKVGAIMLGGPVGWAATGALYMADEAKPADTAKEQVVDAGLGLVKGVAFKGLVGGVLGAEANLGLKAGAMSLGGRSIETFLSRGNYYDEKGQFAPATGLKNAAMQNFSPTNLAMDAAAVGVGYGLGYGVTKAFGPVLERSAFWTRIASSGVTGMSNGAIAEINIARAAGESVSVSRVGTRALATGALYSVAAIPGALQADQTDFRQYQKQGTVKAEKLTQSRTWKSGNGDTMTGEAGDWLLSDGKGNWTVKPDIFAKTYGEVPGSPGEYMKTALGTARRLTFPTKIQTLEGVGTGKAGDYLMRGPVGEEYIVSAEKFNSMYRPYKPAPVAQVAKPAVSAPVK